MQKTAQKRNVYNKLREWSNVSGKAAEAFFNPQFKQVMEHIRQKDDQIRTFVVGKKLGDAEMDPGGPALKDILKQAKSNLNKREYMIAGHDLATFHEQAAKIVAEIKSINHKVDEVHNEFLYEKLTDEQKEKLKGLKTRFAQQQADLIKEAGISDIMDYFHNITSSRGRGLTAWEKRYPSKVNEIKNGLTSLFQKSEGFLDTTIQALKEMAGARSVRNIDDYMKGTVKIEKSFIAYEKFFKDFYVKTFKKYVDDLESYIERMKAHQTTNESTSEKARSPENVQPTQPGVQPPFPTPAARTVPPVSVVAPSETQSTLSLLDQRSVDKDTEEHAKLIDPNGKFTTMRPGPGERGGPPTPLRVNPIIPPPPPLPKDLSVGAHRKFYSSLESLSGENPMMLALFIKKYAGSIKITDPNTSSKLFKIAQQIRG